MLNNKTLVLTNLIPDKDKQNNHDDTILQWLGLKEDGISVLSFIEDIVKHKELNPENSLNTFLEIVKKMKPKTIDASRDHYWRDVIEEESSDLEIEHNPYANELFR